MKSSVQIRRKGHLVEIIDKRNRAALAWCFLGDEQDVEKIADILSQKGLGAAAMELRELAPAGRRNAARARWELLDPKLKASEQERAAEVSFNSRLDQ